MEKESFEKDVKENRREENKINGGARGKKRTKVHYWKQ